MLINFVVDDIKYKACWNKYDIITGLNTYMSCLSTTLFAVGTYKLQGADSVDACLDAAFTAGYRSIG